MPWKNPCRQNRPAAAGSGPAAAGRKKGASGGLAQKRSRKPSGETKGASWGRGGWSFRGRLGKKGKEAGSSSVPEERENLLTPACGKETGGPAGGGGGKKNAAARKKSSPLSKDIVRLGGGRDAIPALRKPQNPWRRKIVDTSRRPRPNTAGHEEGQAA